MDTTIKVRTVQSLMKDIDKKKIDFNSYLQRKSGQWSPAQKSRLIDSLIKNFPIPSIYAVSLPDGGQSVIDGCQRLTSINEFIHGKFKLKKMDSITVEDGSTLELNRLLFENLPEELQSKIMNTELQVITMVNVSNEEIVEVFDRINNGTPLSKVQKSKTLMGFETAKQISIIAGNPVLEKTGLTPGQLLKDDDQMVVVQATMLCDGYNGGTGATATNKFLANFSESPNKNLLDEVGLTFDALNQIVPEKNKALKKAMIPCVIAAMYPIRNDKEKLAKFSISFNEFLNRTSGPSEYDKYSSVHTSSAMNTQGRIEFFKQMI